jgi:osmoprotectant transport system ATP-binding protein
MGEITQDSIAAYLSSGRSRQQTGQPPGSPIARATSSTAA